MVALASDSNDGLLLNFFRLPPWTTSGTAGRVFCTLFKTFVKAPSCDERSDDQKVVNYRTSEASTKEVRDEQSSFRSSYPHLHAVVAVLVECLQDDSKLSLALRIVPEVLLQSLLVVAAILQKPQPLLHAAKNEANREKG